MSVVVGRTIPSVQVTQATVFDGTNPIAQLRLSAHPTTPGGTGTAYTQSSFSAIYYSVYREQRGKLFVVTGYSGLTLTISSQVYNTLQGWDKDSIGYNFQHVIPLAALDASARHVVVYRFVLSASPSPEITVEHRINYRGLGGLSDSSSGSGSSGSTTTPIDLIFSQGAIVTVANTASPATIISGSPTIPANTWSLKNILVVRAMGFYTTKATLAGDFALRVKLGGTTFLTHNIIDIQDGQTNKPWELYARFVRYATGASGTIIGGGEFKNMIDLLGYVSTPAGMTASSTLASDADKVVDVEADWENADTNNSFSCYLLTVGWERVVV